MAEKSQKKEETPLFRCMLSMLTNGSYRSPYRVTGLSIVQHAHAQSSLQQQQQLKVPSSLQITNCFSGVFEPRTFSAVTCLPNG
jgi:hypothetical protein